VKSLGGVWRFGRSGWSAFVSYNEGFGPPDAGLILRAVKTPASRCRSWWTCSPSS
jgi:iron complex outermembrane receptor protein